jgi:hypothetical protein
MGMSGWDSAWRGRPGCPIDASFAPSIGVSVWIIVRQQAAPAVHAIGGVR